jgi:hypothetical protein
LFKAGCTLSAATGISAFRTSDYEEPIIDLNVCTTTESVRRTPTTVTKCTDFGADVTSCFYDSDCHFNPNPAIPVANDDTGDCPPYDIMINQISVNSMN